MAALAHATATGTPFVIAKWDRLARNVAFTAAFSESRVEFVACYNPHATRFTIHSPAAVAEREAAMFSQRTKAALAAAKARGQKLGNPNGARAPRSGQCCRYCRGEGERRSARRASAVGNRCCAAMVSRR